jgi:hypothetical protein
MDTAITTAMAAAKLEPAATSTNHQDRWPFSGSAGEEEATGGDTSGRDGCESRDGAVTGTIAGFGRTVAVAG